MPRTRSLAWAQLKIGIVALVAIGLAIVMIFLVSGEGGMFWQRYSLKTVFTEIPGLKEGAPVRVAGFVRYALGEGIERSKADFAAEVAAQLGG